MGDAIPIKFFNKAEIENPVEEGFGNQKLSMYFAVTKTCNIRCSYCYVPEYNKANQGEIDREAKEATELFLDKVKEEGIQLDDIALHGAEPSTLTPEVLSGIVKNFLDHGASKVHIRSNGIRVNANYISHFKGMEDKFYFGYSIDGSERIHNKWRAKTYKLAMKSLFEAKKQGFKVHVLSVITPDTIEFLDEFEEWCDMLDENNIPYTQKLIHGDTVLSVKEQQIFGEWQYRTKRLHASQVFGSKFCHHAGNKCHWFEFDVDGKVYACNKTYAEEGAFANWKEDSFGMVKLKRSQLFDFVPVSRDCITCEYRSVCNSGCPSDRDHTTGKSLDCAMKHYVYGLMKENNEDRYGIFFSHGQQSHGKEMKEIYAFDYDTKDAYIPPITEDVPLKHKRFVIKNQL